MDSEIFLVETLGCPKNEVDSRMIVKRLLDEGFRVTTDPKEAQVVIINTCGFLQEALEELKERVRYWRRKRKFVILTGCAVERLGVKALSSPNTKAILLDDLLDSGLKPKRFHQRVLPTFQNQFFEKGRFFHYLKVQEGCTRRCSYCVISKIRGDLRSRSIEDILQEVEWARGNGVKEIMLLAQDLTLYGIDRREKLLNLLKRLPSGVYYRLMYLHPHGINEELVKFLKDSQWILPYLHVPIQHISSKVLRDMRRAGNAKAVKKGFELIRSHLPHFFIRTDVIVGFPTEDDGDFEELIDFLEKEKPERIAIFEYSREEGTTSFGLGDLPEEVKGERYQLTFEIAHKIMEEAQRKLRGKEILAFKEGNTSWTQYDASHIDFQIEIKGVRDDRWFGFVKVEEVLETLDIAGSPIKP